MAMPLGGNARLAFNTESTYGSAATIDASNGLRLYYDSFASQVRKEPQDTEEISGVSIDRLDLTEGAVIAGGNLTYRVRYFGGHAVLFGLAMGELVTTSGSPNNHVATLADTLDSATFIHQIPVQSGVTPPTYYDDNYVGCKVASCTWAHRSGEAMTHSMNLIASYNDYDATPVTLPSAAGRVPATTEPMVNWFHKATPEFTIDRGAVGSTGGLANFYCHSWEITLDNALARQFRIQTGRKSAEPPRDGFREVTFRFEVEQDAGWDEFLQAFGYLNTATAEYFSINMLYQDPATANNTLQFELSNCKLIDVPRSVTTPRSLRQIVEGRAHYVSGSTNYIASPLRISMSNATAGPSGTTYGAMVPV